MKNVSLLLCSLLLFTGLNAQTTYQRVYTTLNTKCQNASCHSNTSSNDGPKFDGSETDVHNAIFNVPSQLFPSSVNKFEQLVKPQHPYTSFLLRKIAGADFDTDLAIDTATEGHLMLDTAGQPLTKIEIEWIRQWIRYGAKQTYSNNEGKPSYTAVSQYYTDSVVNAFLPKPAKPAVGQGFQFRMGPVFLPVSGNSTEQEMLQQQEVNFPYQPEIYEIDGYMNQQSHHFILFQYIDTNAARSAGGSNGQTAPDLNSIAQITPSTNAFANAFDGYKNFIGGWQTDENLILPQGTAFFWDQKTYLDMNFHMKNYNATGVLPCDFYFNVYYRPRSVATIPMQSTLVNNVNFGVYSPQCGNFLPNALPDSVPFSQLYDDPDNAQSPETRYLWMVTGHTHKYGTAFYLLLHDTTDHITDTLYDGSYDYKNNYATGVWDHSHPGVEYWPNFHPIQFGLNNSGLTALTAWKSMEPCIGFGFTTNKEMQLYYYSYVTQLPAWAQPTGIKEVASGINFSIMPNPMSTTGKLVYTLDKTSEVQASIIDVTGKTIAQLNNETEQQGTHEVTITNGQKLATGIYFARLTVDGVASNKKFIVTE